MKPCLENRRIAVVNATRSWHFTIQHRVYSCPDTAAFADVLGATALILTNGAGSPVPLAVSTVIRVAPEDASQLDALAQPFHKRLQSYREAAAAEPGILRPGLAHRFYFLEEEPWPVWLQELTKPNQCPDMEWAAIRSICTEPNRFFEWPQVGELLWSGCTRGNADQVHDYPKHVADRLLKSGVLRPDRRSNGPAIMAFIAAGGRRPTWGNEGWPIHHIYDAATAPAVKDGRYFTHSAGLVAAHPVAHHLAHHSPLLKWLLRREASIRFGFDPDGAFNH